MSTPPSRPATVLASCSFCGKDNTMVNKLIAGRGVYICNECVGLCGEILAAPSTSEQDAASRAAFEHRSISQMLEDLSGMARTADVVESDLRLLVARLRTSGAPWHVIADRLGVDPPSAQARFGQS